MDEVEVSAAWLREDSEAVLVCLEVRPDLVGLLRRRRGEGFAAAERGTRSIGPSRAGMAAWREGRLPGPVIGCSVHDPVVHDGAGVAALGGEEKVSYPPGEMEPVAVEHVCAIDGQRSSIPREQNSHGQTTFGLRSLDSDHLVIIAR